MLCEWLVANVCVDVNEILSAYMESSQHCQDNTITKNYVSILKMHYYPMICGSVDMTSASVLGENVY